MSATRTNFFKKLEHLQTTITNLSIDDKKKASLIEESNKIYHNIILFDDKKLYFYSTIEDGLKALEGNIKYIKEQEKKKDTQTIHDAIQIQTTYGTNPSTQPPKLDTNASSSTSFSLLSYFTSCFGHRHHTKTENQPNIQTHSDESISNPEIKASHETKTSAFRNGLSYISSLFFSCFGRRSKGYEPIKTAEEESFSIRKRH